MILQDYNPANFYNNKGYTAITSNPNRVYNSNASRNYNGINFNYEVIRTLEIKDFIEEYGDTLLFCAGKSNVSWRNVGYTLKSYKECNFKVKI